MIDRDSPLSVLRQCELLELSRSTYYHESASETTYNLELMRHMDEQYTQTPLYGVRKMWEHVRGLGHQVNIKRVRRLYHLMGLQSLSPGPATSTPSPEHTVYLYLLRVEPITRINHVWSSDITYVPVSNGFFCLTAVIDWFSRFVLSWRLSNSLNAEFCCAALREAIDRYGVPEIVNTDHGSQYTSDAFQSILKGRNITISMDGRGRAPDNVFIERLWRRYQYEYVYLHYPASGFELHDGTHRYFTFFNDTRPHSSFNGKTPGFVYLR